MSAAEQVSWETAVRRLLDDPQAAELCRACYYDRPALAAAQRYADSDEWHDIRTLLGSARGLALDVGAGMGIASYALARDGWQVTALEPDPSDLVGAGAVRQLAAQGNLSIEVAQEWGESLPFGTGRFDLVHARQVLHHARNLKDFCAELHRVLKPGGMLIASREHVISRPEDLPAFLARHPLHHLYGGENAFMLREYLGCLSAAGFEVRQVIGPFDSSINLAPHTPETLVAEIGERVRRIPLMRHVVAAALARPWRRGALRMLSRIDRRPGRLFTFVATKRST